MPRKGTRLSPEAEKRNADAIAAYHAQHYENLSITMRKGKRDAWKRLAEARGESVSGMIQRYMDSEYEKQFGEKPV